jgi:hypothetical protein
MADPNQIIWPSRYDPKNCPIHVRNELAMDASPEAIWAWLIRAELWPTWYSNSANILFLSGAPPDLSLGARFRWKTFGITIESKVMEFVVNERLAWDAHGSGLDAYHAWLIRRRDQGCNVLMEETQRGWAARLNTALRPKQMEQLHQVWLEGLRDRASSGLPPQHG